MTDPTTVHLVCTAGQSCLFVFAILLAVLATVSLVFTVIGILIEPDMAMFLFPIFLIFSFFATWFLLIFLHWGCHLT